MVIPLRVKHPRFRHYETNDVLSLMLLEQRVNETNVPFIKDSHTLYDKLRGVLSNI